ncbi:MAG TPA: carboxypeptidase regulatory-like domain-containing protein [Vicinamibacterales bacterium]|nr:carboxypeptidase regulatory-like domain-containing protein [Vicinamibacterales bacterium]
MTKLRFWRKTKNQVPGTLLLLSALIAPAAAFAQSTSIAGVVSDPTGGVMPGVTVEAASPALIEGSRSATTDASGRYTITELRPGVYTVTFTLTGFSTVKREGIELTANFAANVNAQMRVGSLEETVTVSGASPVIDVQNVVKQRLVQTEVIDAVPTGKSWSQLGVTTVGVSSTLADVGGSAGENQNPMTAHGGFAGDKIIDMEGMRLGLLGAGGAYASTGVSSNDASTQEISYEIGAISAEVAGGGVRVNIIPKDGGNRFSGSLFGNYGNHSMVSDNFTGVQRFQLAGVHAPDSINRIYDTSAALGGPIAQDKLWFFTAHREWGFQNLKSDAYYEVNPLGYQWDYRPGGLIPDPSKQAFDDQKLQSHNARLTWQMDPKNKISAYVDFQPRCTCHWQVSATRAGEASFIQNLPLNWQGTITYNSAISDRLLFSAGFGNMSARWTQLAQTDGVPIDPATGQPSSYGYGIQDIGYNIVYRAPATSPNATNFSATHSYRASLSYVTGSHSAKFGFGLINGPLEIPQWMYGPANDSYLVYNSGVPVALIRYATPTDQKDHLDADLGAFAQDQWRVKRFTFNLGLRFDWLKESVPAQHFAAGTWVPARDYPAVDNVPNWKDLDPRLGVVYDLFGNGKTALKATLSRYVQEESTATAQNNNPLNLYRFSSQQAWTDSNHDGIPEPNELSGPQVPLTGQPGGAGPVGSAIPLTAYDPSYLVGWGKRRYNWEVSAGVQHELVPRISVDATYYRRAQGNFTSTHNLAVTPANYQSFCVTTPNDPRLPNPGAQVCGLYDLTVAAGSIPTQNVVQFDDASQQRTEVWNGIDLAVNARIRAGTFISGGVSSGKTSYSNCGVINNPGLFQNGTPSLTTFLSFDQYCAWDTPFLTQLKLAGVHTFWWDIQGSVAFQSNPGPLVLATYNAPNSVVAPSLGHNLISLPSGYPIDLIKPGSQYGDRLNQVDLRFAKVIKLASNRRIKGMLDIYNALNSNAVVTQNNTYGANWAKPTQILVGRFLKVGGQFEF